MRLIALFNATLLLCIGLVLQGCPQPGEGAKAEQGYRVCQPIIDALTRYQVDTGVYPESLIALTPDYLAAIPQEVNRYPIRYTKTPLSYQLRFSYEGPGMNHCDYTPETGWDCQGYY